MTKILDAQGDAVSTPDILGAINESSVAQDTVDEMQTLLDRLSKASQTYALETADLFLKLEELNIPLQTTVRLYAALKQAYMTTIFVVQSEVTRQEMVTNLFSLLLGNALLINKFTEIPTEVLPEVVIIITNIMFQIEAGDGDSEQTTESN